MRDPASASAPDPAAIQAAAEEVRAWLVTVRGSAPFLSSADGQLLLTWLEQGVPVGAIIAAIDTVAERRRQRRARRRLTLKDCRKAVEAARRLPEDRTAGRGGPEHFERPPASPGADHGALDAPVHPGLHSLAGEIRATAVPDALVGARDATADTLARLAADPRHADEIGREAAASIRAFHEAAWEASRPEHSALHAAAEEELAPMRAGLRQREWQGLVEEVARDHLRRRTPAMSGRRVWDTLAG